MLKKHAGRALRLLKLLCCMLAAAALLPAVRFARAENGGDGERGFSLTVTASGMVRSYQDNVLTVNSSVSGTLTLTVADELNEWGMICRDKAVCAGETVLHWDGLGDNGIHLDGGAYFFLSVLTEADGTVHASSSTVKVDRSQQAVLFALSSGDTVYRGGGWYAEVRMLRTGVLVTEICRADAPETPVYTKRREITNYRPLKWEWQGTAGSEQLPAGDYILRFYAEESPEFARELRVTLTDEAEKTPAVAPTGPIMPQDGSSNAEIWSLMTAPAVVVDLRNTSHQKVFAEPDRRARSLGTLHGQSQALEVLEVCADGWTRIRAWEHETGAQVEGYVPTERLKAVYPQTEYGLLLDKRTQTMTVYRRGEKLGTVRVSTGMIEKNKLYRETAAGSFLTQEHMSDYSMNGKKYQYVIRYDGGNLLHAIAYYPTDGLKDFAKQTATLGRKASNGCVRIQPTASEDGGLNAWWLWTHIGANTRLIILDDPMERETQRSALNGAAAAADDADEDGSGPRSGNTEIVLTVGGDIALGTRESWQEDENALPAVIAREGGGWLFSGLETYFQTDDITLVNLECVLKDTAEGEDLGKQYRFRGLPAWASALAAAGIEQVNLANNHVIDYGAAGAASTRAALKSAGVSYSGYGDLAAADVKGHRIGFAGCRETVFAGNPGVIRAEVNALRAAGCEAVIYSCHWGTEYAAKHNGVQERMARAAAAAGADIVVGTHPHVVQGIADKDGTLVLWSLGNLMFGGTHDLREYGGTLYRLRLRFSEDSGYLGVRAEPVPVMISGASEAGVNDFRPVIAEGDSKERILAQIRRDTDAVAFRTMFFPARTAR